MKANLLAAELNAKKIGPSPSDIDDTVTRGWTTSSGVKIPSLVDVAKGVNRNAFRAYNCLYGFLNEEQVMKPYSKQWDFKETEGAAPNSLAYIPGSSSSTDEIRKFQFGFEICFDHANGALLAKHTAVDFHIVVSDSVSTETGKMSMSVGGYFIHSSSNHLQTGVYYRDGLGTHDLGNPYAGAKAANRMAYWLVGRSQEARRADGASAQGRRDRGRCDDALREDDYGREASRHVNSSGYGSHNFAASADLSLQLNTG